MVTMEGGERLWSCFIIRFFCLVYRYFWCAGILIALFLPRKKKVILITIIILPCAVAKDTTDFKYTVICFCTKVASCIACNGAIGGGASSNN